MTETDDIGDAEAFNEIERQAKQRKESVRAAVLREEDDDIQDYKKPWVGLTDEQKQAAIWTDGTFGAGALWAEAKLKEKNT